jgi:hypothetical protein
MATASHRRGSITWPSKIIRDIHHLEMHVMNALEQTTSVSSATYIDVLKYAGTALAAIAAIMRAIPQVSSYLSRRKTTVYQTYRLRIFSWINLCHGRTLKSIPRNGLAKDIDADILELGGYFTDYAHCLPPLSLLHL